MEGSFPLLFFQATALMLREGAVCAVGFVLNGGEVWEEMAG